MNLAQHTPFPDYIREFPPALASQKHDLSTLYWIQDGTVMYGSTPIKGADIGTFRFYQAGFAKDKNKCYHRSKPLQDSHSVTFRALNFTYVTDSSSIWTMVGKVEGADAKSFTVCDDGAFRHNNGLVFPYSYAKDKDRVYYYDFEDKPVWVDKASPSSFISLNDGHFGKDDSAVFCGGEVIKEANVNRWQKISGYYSKDDARIFYFGRVIADADYDSFEVVPHRRYQYAKDKHRFYANDQVLGEKEFQEQFERSNYVRAIKSL